MPDEIIEMELTEDTVKELREIKEEINADSITEVIQLLLEYPPTDIDKRKRFKEKGGRTDT